MATRTIIMMILIVILLTPNAHSIIVSESLVNNESGTFDDSLDVEAQDAILNLIDNETRFDKLIKNKYSRDDIKIGLYSTTLHEYEQKKKIKFECLRKINDNFLYAILLSEERGVMIVLFNKTDDIFISRDYWYFEKTVFKEDFSTLKYGSKYSDVKKIDPFGNDLQFYTSGVIINYPESDHKTFDGYHVSILYKKADNRDDYMVLDVVYKESKETYLSIYSFILEKDMYDIKKYLQQ